MGEISGFLWDLRMILAALGKARPAAERPRTASFSQSRTSP
jgi:hypothetical protein